MREIKARMPFRILAGLICLVNAVVLVFDAKGLWETYSSHWMSLVSLFTIMPLFVYATLFGKLPDFLVRHLSDETFEELERAETLFTRFDARSIAFAVVFLTMAAYMMYSRNN